MKLLLEAENVPEKSSSPNFMWARQAKVEEITLFGFKTKFKVTLLS